MDTSLGRIGRACLPALFALSFAAASGAAGVRAAGRMPPSAARLPPLPVPATVRPGARLATAAGRLGLGPLGTTRRSIRLFARGRTLAVLTAPGWLDVWAWQATGPYVALWIGMPAQPRPTTGDAATTIVVLNVRTRTLAIETSIDVQTRAYLGGHDLIATGSCGTELLRWCPALYDLPLGTLFERAYGTSVSRVELAQGKLFADVYRTRRAPLPAVQRWSVPPAPWRRWASEAWVRVAFPAA